MNFNKIKITVFTVVAGILASANNPAIPKTFGESNRPIENHREKEGKYAILVRKVPHIQASIKTRHQMKADGDHQVDQFQVIICGKVVKKLGDRPKINKMVEKGQDSGIRFLACGMSMDKFGIERADLADGIKVIPNGIIHMFDLQEKGYHTVEL